MNIAELGIRIDSSDATRASAELEKFSQSGARAEQSAAGLLGEISSLEKSLATGAKSTSELAKQREQLAKLTKAGAYSESELVKITAQLDKQQASLVKSSLEEEKALQSLLRAVDPAAAKMAKLDKQVESLGKQLDAGKLSQEDYSKALSKLEGKDGEIKKTDSALGALSLTTKGGRENVVQLANALAEGNFRVAAHNIAEIGASAGSSSTRLLALAAPIALVTAAIGSLAYGYVKGKAEAEEYNKQLILTGNYAGTSVSQLSEMARQISATVGATGAAAQALTTLAGSGKIASSSFVEIAEAAVSMEKATGKAVDDTISEFIKIADDPVKAAKELDEQYHFLTASVYSQIVALKEQGDTIGATKLLTDTYADTVKSRAGEITQNLGYVERAWKGIKSAASGALDTIKNVGRDSSLDDQIADAERRLKIAETGSLDPFGRNKEAANAIREQLDMLKSQRDAEKDIAKYEGERGEQQRKAKEAMREVDLISKSALSNDQKRTKEIKDYRRWLEDIRKASPNDERLKQANVDRGIANINDKYKDPKAPSSPVDLSSFNEAKSRLAEITSSYRNAEKELEAAQRAGVISQESYSQQRVSIIQQEQAEVQNAYKAEIAALEAVKSRSTTSAQQRIQLDQRIADARTAMVKAQQDADSQLEIISLNEQGRLRKQAQAVKTYTDALDQQAEALRQQGLRDATGVGMGSRQRGLFQQQNALDDRLAQQKIDLANQYGDGSRGMSLDEYNQKLEALEANHRKMTNQLEQNYEDLTSAESSWTNGAKSAFQDYIDSANNVAGQTYSMFTNAFSSIEDGIVKFVKTGKLSFKDMADSIISDLIRIQVRQAAAGFISSAMGGGGGIGSLIGGSQSMSFGGGRAVGGSVDPDKFYEVNEKGPELFSQGGRTYLMSGSQGGYVTPIADTSRMSSQSSGSSNSGGGVAVHQTFHVAGDVSQETLNRMAEMSRQAAEQGAQSGYRMVMQDVHRNGPIRQRLSRG